MRVSSFVWRVVCSVIIVPAVAAQRGGNRPVVIDPAASIDIVVRPVRNGSPDVQYAEIREHIVRSPGVTSAEFAVRVPGGPPGPPAPAGLETVEMVDTQGAVPVRADSGNNRRWRAERPVTFPVTVTFRARMWPPGTRTNPSYMLRAAEGAVSGQGSGILITPDDGVEYAGRFRWDLSDLAGSMTTSGLTDDNDVRAPLSTLSMNFFMAGPLRRYPANGDRDGFAAYWHGTPPWDAPQTMAWVASMYEYMRTFWGETAPRRYRVMGRMLPPPAYGGTALPNHFIFNAPAGPRDTTQNGPQLLLAHETGHLFVRGLQNPGGGGPSNNWFTEGMNEYYAVTLALRSGLAPLDLVLQEMNVQTRNYYTNPRKNMPADSVAMANPMTDGRAQNVSYERGILFWADMDARIRAASNGRRNLDSVIVPLITRARTLGGEGGLGNQARQGGQPGWFTPSELVDSLVKAAGPTARQTFDSVIVRGKSIVPVSNAFGPCFELRPTQMPDRYLGSADARAQASSAPPVPEITAYLWARVSSVPDERCRKW